MSIQRSIRMLGIVGGIAALADVVVIIFEIIARRITDAIIVLVALVFMLGMIFFVNLTSRD